jgi:RND family efflux transporter MFP subunit
MFRLLKALITVGAVLLSACSPTPSTQAPIRAVKVITVSESLFSAESEFAAEVKARIESRLGFRIPGKLTARHVELGQHVKAGQLLAEIDAQDYRLSVDSARAQVNAAQTNRDLAAADYKRYKELRDKEFISGAELERRETAYKAAQSQLEQAQAQFSTQTNQLNYSKLYADKPGVVTGLEVEVGQVINAGTPIVRIAQDGLRDVVFAVPEDRVADIKQGQVVRIKLWSRDQIFTGKVQEIAASADPVTRTFTVKSELNEAKIPLGSTATVFLKNEVGNSQTLTLPTTAVRQEAGKSSIWIVDPATMTVQSHEIQIAGMNENSVVVSGGLSPGQQVVTAGIHVLSPGQKVTYFKSAGEKP